MFVVEELDDLFGDSAFGVAPSVCGDDEDVLLVYAERPFLRAQRNAARGHA